MIYLLAGNTDILTTNGLGKNSEKGQGELREGVINSNWRKGRRFKKEQKHPQWYETPEFFKGRRRVRVGKEEKRKTEGIISLAEADRICLPFWLYCILERELQTLIIYLKAYYILFDVSIHTSLLIW